MSISASLRRAAKLQEKIESLRHELATILDETRAELAAQPTEDFGVPAPRRGRPPKMLKASMKHATAGRKIDGRTRAARALRRGRSPLAGVKRAASPTGPLAPAVVKVLQVKGKPMPVRDILAGLLANGYQFNSTEPKKNLAARIYRLRGVKQVGAGLFAIA